MASPFSGRSGRLAAMEQIKYLGGVQDNIDTLIKNNRRAGIRSLDAGYDKAYKDYGKAYDLYQPYADTGRKAYDLYSDAIGVNGDEGYDRAVGNFRASPGYEWQRDQGTDAVARKASALGALGSGNTMTAIADYSSHLADQEYDDYLSRLDEAGKMGFAATGAQSGILQDRGGLKAQWGRDRAGVYQGSTGMSVSSLASTAGQISDAIKGGYQAGQDAASNRFGAIMGGLGLGAKVLGSAAGAGAFNKWFA